MFTLSNRPAQSWVKKLVAITSALFISVGTLATTSVVARAVVPTTTIKYDGTDGFDVGAGLVGFEGMQDKVFIANSSTTPAIPEGRTAGVVMQRRPVQFPWQGGYVLKLPCPKKINLDASSQVSVDVYSPSGKTFNMHIRNSATTWESGDTTQTTASSGWQTLTFDFSGLVSAHPNAAWDQVLIFPSFNEGDWSGSYPNWYATENYDYFITNLTFASGNTDAVCVLDPTPTLATFENDDTSFALTNNFGGAYASTTTSQPSGNGSTTALKIHKGYDNGYAETWAGARVFKPTDRKITSSDNKILTVNVWSDHAGTPILFKLDPNVEVLKTTSANGRWERMTVDFGSSEYYNNATQYNDFIIFPDFGNQYSVGSPGLDFYFDDIAFNGAVTPALGVPNLPKPTLAVADQKMVNGLASLDYTISNYDANNSYSGTIDKGFFSIDGNQVHIGGLSDSQVAHFNLTASQEGWNSATLYFNASYALPLQTLTTPFISYDGTSKSVSCNNGTFNKPITDAAYYLYINKKLVDGKRFGTSTNLSFAKPSVTLGTGNVSATSATWALDQSLIANNIAKVSCVVQSFATSATTTIERSNLFVISRLGDYKPRGAEAVIPAGVTMRMTSPALNLDASGNPSDYVDFTHDATDNNWAQYYGPGLKVYYKYFKAGSQISLSWHVTDTTTKKVLKFYPVWLVVNKNYGGSEVGTFTYVVNGETKTVAARPGSGTVGETQIPGTTDANGDVTFVLTNTTSVGNAEPAPVALNKEQAAGINTMSSFTLTAHLGTDERKETKDIIWAHFTK